MSTAAKPHPLPYLQIEVIDQALALINVCSANAGIDFGVSTGPHLRHIIEHYEALTTGIASAPIGVMPVVDYDARQRDRAVERNPLLAQARLQQLKTTLSTLPTDVLDMAVAVHLQAGPHGELRLVTQSTIGRELLFVASHAVHHFAIIKLHIEHNGVVLNADFGKAPATIANQLQTQAALVADNLPWRPSATSTPTKKLPLLERVKIGVERARRWEFWPSWLFYVPIFIWFVLLAIRHRGLTICTAVNPLLESGGFVGERKHVPLALLQKNAPDLVATFELIDAGNPEQRQATALAFARKHAYPVVVKPDVGQRGRGVLIARDADQLCQYLDNFSTPLIIQRYVGGAEFGVFVSRAAADQPLQVLSIVHKTFPTVSGDGRRSLRELILADQRARLIVDILFARWAAQLDAVPAAGETVLLVEIGAHCRGSVFRDGSHLLTPALLASMTKLVDAVPGYQFGRIDLRAPDCESLQRGIGLQVMEFNGIAAESAHIYDPGSSLLNAYRAMFKQWQLAFSIGARNAKNGVPITPTFELLRRSAQNFSVGATWF